MELTQFVREQWDRVLGWVAIAVGAVCLLLGYLGVSRQALPAGQLPYVISDGLGDQ